MGTSFTVDTPLKVAQYGISSVLSIGDNQLCEDMRAYYAKFFNEPYAPIPKTEPDYHAKRVTAYLNLINSVVKKQIEAIKKMTFDSNTALTTYFELLPDNSALKQLYNKMRALLPGSEERTQLETQLRSEVKHGAIDVNIMSKVDRDKYDPQGNKLPDMYSDALSSFRGFALSELKSSVVFSAGFNRRLYSYISEFTDFYPNALGYLKKRIILKVSDFRSTAIQGKILAKKGLWISEYRIESGLNCGGHAFATNGSLLGPILEEFIVKKEALLASLCEMCNHALERMGKTLFNKQPESNITVQGGVGTHNEHQFLLDHFRVASVGWATPFLLVPEATNVDKTTLELLRQATPETVYLSRLSPLGLPFNSIRNTQSAKVREARIAAGTPGSPCPKGHLGFNTEFTERPICLASRQYQQFKLAQLRERYTNQEAFNEAAAAVMDKACLCEDLAAGAYLNLGISHPRVLAPAICPGPNLVYFSTKMTLKEMMGHIYGRINKLNSRPRPNMFIQELKMYIDYFANELKNLAPKLTAVEQAYLNEFKTNLLEGITYYKQLIPKMIQESKKYQQNMLQELSSLKNELETVVESYQHVLNPVFNTNIAPQAS